MSVDVKVLVDEIESILFAIVAENVLLLVRVAQFHDLAANQIADTSSNADEGEAVRGDPKA